MRRPILLTRLYPVPSAARTPRDCGRCVSFQVAFSVARSSNIVTTRDTRWASWVTVRARWVTLRARWVRVRGLALTVTFTRSRHSSPTQLGKHDVHVCRCRSTRAVLNGPALKYLSAPPPSPPLSAKSPAQEEDQERRCQFAPIPGEMPPCSGTSSCGYAKPLGALALPLYYLHCALPSLRRCPPHHYGTQVVLRQ